MFVGGGLVCVMADGGHHGEGEHDERHVAVPAVPGPGFSHDLIDLQTLIRISKEG